MLECLSVAILDRSTILCGHPLTGWADSPIWPAAQETCHARDPPLLPTCITMHRRSPAKLPEPRSARVDDMRHSAAKDRTFKTVRPNQGTASGTVPIRRRPSL